jgi:hypothetical protein
VILLIKKSKVSNMCRVYALKVGVLTRSGFSVFGQNREPESKYPDSLFWETGTRTRTSVLPGSQLPAGSDCTRSGNRFFFKKKITFWAYFRCWA